MRLLSPCVLFVVSTPLYVVAQSPCNGTTLSGAVLDPTSALIPNATLTLDAKQTVHSGSDGRYAFVCVGDGSHRIAVEAEGFARRVMTVATPHSARVDALLQPAAVQTEVEVDGGDDAPPSANSAGPTQNISGKQLQSLADDPDDLLRELQQLASASGANPANVTIAVDGFQGSSTLPPKSSIAYIKVNPDLFAAEYREPPFEGSRVEIYTKPGQKTYHGALFTTNGSPWENARDPLSTSKAAIGKQRYGFEFSGPVRKVGSDFAMALEHRSIDNFAAVNAVSVSSSGAQVPVTANVATPQRLWVGSARLDWQLSPKNTFIASYSANVNHLVNVGVGGPSEQDSGYDSFKYDHALRLSVITTATARLMHEGRMSLRWDGENDAANSTAPQIQVAGAFTSGGATIGNQRLHEFNVEFDDDAILTTKAHTIKAGTQFMLYNEHQQVPNNFNGTYVFGGASAPLLDAKGNPIAGQTVNITGIEQYERTLQGCPVEQQQRLRMSLDRPRSTSPRCRTRCSSRTTGS